MFSYGENNTINLSASPITQLVGANGHGKSSIPLIIEEILFNSNSKKIKKTDILNRYSKSKIYEGWVEFAVDGDEYKVIIKRGTTQTVKLFKNGVDISMHTATATYKLIEEILGIDARAFEQLIYQRNSASLEFLTATDTVRKRFLIELLGLEIYTEYFELFKTLSKIASDAVLATSSKIETIQKWLDRLKTEDLNLKTLVELPERVDYSTQLMGLKTELANIEHTNKTINQNNQYKTLLESIDLAILSEQVSNLGDGREVSNQLSATKLLIKQDNDLLKKITSLSSTCPTCMQTVSQEFISGLAKEVRKRIESNSALVQCLETELQNIDKATKLIEKQRRTQEEFEKYSQLYDPRKSTTLLNREGLEAQIKDLEKKGAAQEVQLRNLIETNKTATAHNAKVATLFKQAEEYTAELSEASTQLAQLKDNYNNLELLKKVFSTGGFIAYKLENLVIELQNLANEYLATLSAGRFELSFTVENDKLNVLIIDNGNTISIEALSGGELARVNTATLLAIRKLMSSISKTKINLLVLDETIDTLDTYGKEQLVEILLSEPELNTFIVSHGFTHPLLDKITVVKEKNISRLE